ncbi:carboxymuconolactone decarboxylase family protein [Nocardia asteroides]|uniref:carboxymuconolactone decarboxylase family protein n=1 Tax=Nocardia asteroides TaxID=1824 RepID=UPI001E41B63E|nr:carboxymuconolactone decarboxylase family protein [Nocardia asteroides]UGT62049.1 carboxymuconolactone decarboxylase family protein [Nocardia asteroides]
MTLVPLVERESATGTVREQLDSIHAAFGTVPAMFRAVANSPAALTSMWAAFGAFGGGALGPAVGERIAVAVANRNACEYCLAAHTALGRRAGVGGADMRAAQLGESPDPRTAALLGFALKLVAERGQVAPEEVGALRDLGWSDEQIVEAIGQVALNLFTNYINVALGVPLDFPKVALR